MAEQNSLVRLQPELIEEHFAKWSDLMSQGPTDRHCAEAAIRSIYEKQDRAGPAIVWCQSPYQMVTLPSLFFGIIHSDLWQWVAGELVMLDDAELEVAFAREWPQIWGNSGFPILQGMNSTSSLIRDCGHLEGALTSQLKSQLLVALKKRSLDALNVELKREIYRVFWTRRMPQEVGKTAWLRLKDDVFTTVGFVHTQQGQWHGWDHCHALDRKLYARGNDIASMLRALVSTWGAEPAGQEDYVSWFTRDLNWLAATELFLNTAGDTIPADMRQEAQTWIDLVNSASGAMFFPNIVFCCDRFLELVIEEREIQPPFNPSLENQLSPVLSHVFHNESGPVLSSADGFQIYAWHNVRVAKIVITDPDSITIEMIDREQNAEVRRVMMERYGIIRYIEDCNAQMIDSDDFGTLYRKELPGDEPIVMVKVVNSTPEPDGTYKDYFLRVPPWFTSAKKAVAWTFGYEQDDDDYDPSVQT